MRKFLFIMLVVMTSTASAQSEFDRLVDDLFFNLPNYGGLFEVKYAILGDTTFFDLKEPMYDQKTERINASFASHKMLHYLKDTSSISFVFYDSVRVFNIKSLNMIFKESEAEALDLQFQEIFDYFEDISFMWKENPDFDRYKGESYTFYGDEHAYSQEAPRLSIHYNFHPARKKGNEGFYTMSVSYTEEK